MKSTKEKAADYFEGNPGTAELFGSSDGTLFLMKQHALAHAHTLDDKDVDTFRPVEMQKHIVTQEDLDANPDLANQGVVVGEEIQFEPVKAKAPAVKKVVAPKAPAVKKAKAPAVKKEITPKAPVVKKEETPKAEGEEEKPKSENTPPAV